MLETLLRLLERLPDWAVYREVATVLDGDSSSRGVGGMKGRPERDALVSEVVRILDEALSTGGRPPASTADP